MKVEAQDTLTIQVRAAGQETAVRLESYTTADGHVFYGRPGTEDAGVFRYVVDANEYRLPDKLAPDDVILDIGAHIGSFSYAVLQRGAGRVYAYEAHPINHALACKNLAGFEGRLWCLNKAVWRSDVQASTLYNDVITESIPTGGISVLWNNEGIPVETVSLDDVIFEASNGLRDRISLLKIDCEGSEYPILFSSKHLALIDEICGEYHEIEEWRVPERAKVAGKPVEFNRHTLKKFLESEGWSVELEPKAEADGLFFARQKKRLWSGAGEAEINVDKLMAEIKRAAAQRAVEIGAPLHRKTVVNSSVYRPIAHSSERRSAGTPAASILAEAPRLVLQPEFHPSPESRYHINDLLKYHDRAFVRNAYFAVLKREPDEAGLAQQLDLLRSGRFDKIDILAALSFSPEGRSKNVRVEGLARPAFARRLGRLPLIGYLYRLISALAQLPSHAAAGRQFEAYSLAQHQQAADFINQVLADLYRRAEHADAHRQQVEALARSTQHEVEVLAATQERLREATEAAEAQLRREMAEAREEGYARLAAGTEQMRTRAETLAQTIEERIKQLTQKLQQTRTELVLQERRVSLLIEEGRKRLPPPGGGDGDDAPAIADEQQLMLGAFYNSFEDLFRGSRADIKERLSVYLPYVERTAAIAGDIVDIGCGRGEWLEVLGESGLRARGVDRNGVAVEECRRCGLEAVEGDALAYLRGLGAESLRVVTAFHFIEHLPFTTLLAFLGEAARVLKPGGVLICETPNPENLVVGSCNFYLDPDHLRPLPSALMSFILEVRGFCRIETIRLNANDSARVNEASELAHRLNDFLYGPQDYAVVGWKV